MEKARPFGLTGNIGCGKSTVAALLSGYSDVFVADCDLIAKEIIINGDHKQAINSILGMDVFASGKADLRAIARIIFGDRARKIAFEGFIHPLVWSVVNERMSFYGNGICVVESAIIYETKSENRFRGVITAVCSRETQVRRLKEKRGMTDDEIYSRMAEQITSLEMELRSQYVINTDCSMEELKSRAEDLYILLKKEVSL